MILQPANEVNQLRALAAQSKPAFDSALREVAERTPGLTLFGTRLKQAQRLQEKLAGGRAPNAVSDYLGARVWADTPEGFDAALGALRERFTILNVDDFREQPRTGGYRAVHAQVRLPNGLSAEVQLVPRTIGEIQEQWHGRFLGRWRGKDINRLGPEEARQYQADYEQATAAFDDAYARFVGRPRAEVGMGAPPAEAAGVPPPRRGPPPEAPPAPAPDPIPDPHEGIAAQLRAEPAERAAAARAGRDPLGLAAAPAGAPGPFARQAEQVSGAVQQTLRIVDDIGKRARIALEQEQVITRTGTLAEEIRPAFGRAGPKPETFRLRVSEEDVRLGTAELVRVAREWKRLRQQVLDFGDPMAANTVRAADALLDQAAEQWNLLRHATGRSVKAFDVPPNVRALLQEAGVMVDRLQAARPRLPIYTNIFRSLRRFGSLNAVEQRQFWRDLVDAWRLNLFSVTSWTLDLVGNLAEVGAQVTGGVGRDIYHAAGGRLNFPSLQGWTRAIRERARHVGQPLAPEIEEAFGSTVGGELVRAGFRGGPGTFTLRQTAATKTIDYLVGGPLYAKGVMDTAAKRLSATASLWRDAIEQANRLDLRGLARRQFYDEFFYRLPDDVIQRAIEAGNKAGFNRELTNLEERIARSVGFRLLGDAFARWPFQFSRTMGEWIGINPALFRKIRAGTVRGEEIAEYVTKSATGLGGLWLLDRTLYDRVDFNSMEYVHENGERTRLSGRDPIPTALWLLATVKGDTARSTAALRNASLPFARVLAGEPGLLGGLVRQFVEASRRADIDARAMSRELTNTVNRAIPGQALLSMVKSVFDPVLREGVGAQLPGVSLALPARVEPTTGKPLVPRQRIPGIPFELPAVGGIPIPGARRVTEPVFNLLSRFGLLVYRGPRQPIAGVPAAEVPEELRREWEEAFGKHRQRLLRPLADRLDKLERGDPERVRKMIQSRDAAAARIATQEVTRRHGGRRVLLPRQPTIRERRGPAAFTPAGR